MKRVLTIAFIITIAIQSSAQIRKGAILIGGGLNFTGSKSTEETSFGFNGSTGEEAKESFFGMRGSLGFFTSESTLVGIGLGYENNSIEQTPMQNGIADMPFKFEDNILLINPYLTKYSKLGKKLYFTTTFNILIGTGKGELGLSDGQLAFEQIDTKISQLQLNITPGLNYFLTNKLALTCNVGQLFYNRRKEKLSESSLAIENLEGVDKDYGLSVSFNTFLIGFQYFLNNGSDE